MTVVGGAFRGIGVVGEVGGPQWGGDVVKGIPEEHGHCDDERWSSG